MTIVISFDLDGVLLPDPLEDTVFEDLIIRLAQEIAPLQGWSRSQAEEEVRRRVWEEFHRQSRAGYYPVEAFDWDAIFIRVSRALGARQAVDIGRMVRELCQRPHEIPSYPEVPEVLAELRRRGARLLVVTNGYAQYQVPLLYALGLATFFYRIVTPDKVGYVKPARGIYRHAFAGLDGRKVHVGDYLLHDVYGAHQAGLEAVWLERCLPVELDGLSQTARLASPVVRGAMRIAMIEEGVPPCAPLNVYMPDYVIRDLWELPALLFS